jgi:hypothetical protein
MFTAETIYVYAGNYLSCPLILFLISIARSSLILIFISIARSSLIYPPHLLDIAY